MQNTSVDLLNLLLAEIIVEYFELTSYKKGEEILPLFCRR